MKRHIHQSQKVKYAVLNAPYLIPNLLNKPYNKAITTSTLNKMLNRSCGIEIECFGSLAYHFNKTFNRNFNEGYNKFEIEKYYNIYNYNEQNYYETSTIESNLQQHYYLADKNFNEHTIRILDYTQLNGLYEILNDMKKYCRLNHGSGIHIHIDITDVYHACNNNLNYVEKIIAPILTTKLDYIEQIFYPNSSYKLNGGSYNDIKAVDRGKCHLWVAIREGYNTIEFRIAPMTFEYNTIVTWCVKLNQLINWAIKQNKELASQCNVRLKKKDKHITKPIIHNEPTTPECDEPEIYSE